jgi:hypothetical protein
METSDELLASFAVASDGIDAFDQALRDSVFQGDAMMAEVLGIVFVFDLIEELVEETVASAVSGDDGEGGTPGGAGKGNIEEFLLILMEGEFIEFDVAGFAGEGVGIGAEGVDALIIGEADLPSGGAIGRDGDLTDETDKLIKNAGPVLTLADVEARLNFVAGGEPDVEGWLVGSGFKDGIEGIGVGNADLARFFDDLETGVVVDPTPLVRKEVEGIQGWK